MPQSIAPTSSPTFNNLAVNGNIVMTSAGAITTNLVQQVGAGQNITIDAGADSIIFAMGGRTFQLPTSGPAAQTICTTGITCVAGGGQSVELAPVSAQTDNTSDASIFINDTGGGNLIQLQAGGTNRFVVATNGDTTVGGILNINTFRHTDGGNTTTIGFGAPTATTTLNFPALSAGTYDICTSGGNCAAAVAVNSLNGLNGSLALANATGLGSTITINDASTAQKGIAQFNAANFSVSSGTVDTIQNIATTSSPTFNGLTLTTALSVANGGTGRTSLADNSLLVGNGTGVVNHVINGSPGECLVSTAGAPVFTACPGTGGVASIDGQTGAVTMNNATGTGSVITIDDASTAQKGIAQFNSTNFSVTSGTVNTIQGIGTSATPTFAGLTLTAPLAVTSGGTGANNATTARGNLGAAASGANSDITSLSGLTTALSVVQGGTGATSLTANGVLIGNGTGTITSVAAGGAGLCLVSTTGTPSWQSCPGTGGVATLNSLTGALTIQGTANQIIVNNNTGTITISTPQDINTSSSPTFSGLTLTSLTVSGDTINDFAGTGLQVVGNALQTTLGTTVDLTSEITGTLPLANGGTNATTAQDALQNGRITEGHSRSILALKEFPEQQEQLLLLIQKHGWPVRQAEQFVVAAKSGVKSAEKAKKRTVSSTPSTKQLSKILNRQVTVNHMAKGGRLVIRFSTDDDLENLIGLLGTVKS